MVYSKSTHFPSASASDGYQLEVYQLPVDAWHKELQEFLTKVSATEEASGSQVSVGSQPEEVSVGVIQIVDCIIE